MFEKDFESMLRRYGDAVEDKKKFTGLIKDFFPQEARTINLMLMAYEIGIVQQIQSIGTEQSERRLGGFSLVCLLWKKYPGERVRDRHSEWKSPGNRAGTAIYKEVRRSIPLQEQHARTRAGRLRFFR